jgi:hypothetical protein
MYQPVDYIQALYVTVSNEGVVKKQPCCLAVTEYMLPQVRNVSSLGMPAHALKDEYLEHDGRRLEEFYIADLQRHVTPKPARAEVVWGE